MKFSFDKEQYILGLTMHFRNIRIQNYKSFNDSQDIAVGPGFNVVLGQNNVGKSALLDAFSALTMGQSPHRRKHRSEDHLLDRNSVSIFEASVSGRELLEAAIAHAQIAIPMPVRQMISSDLYLKTLFNSDSLTYTVTVVNGEVQSTSDFSSDFDFVTDRYEIIEFSPNGNFTPRNSNSALSGNKSLFQWIFSRSIFGFKAERFNVGRHGFSDVSQMDQNARNLPAVLNYIQGNRPSLFEGIKSQMREVFPSVSSLSVGPSGSELVVRIWSGPDSDEISLSNELNSSGTGIGQALAILIVAATMPNGVILIDEINSFLHPLAIKRLINILKTVYGRHQYIISSHAMEIIKWCDPETVTLITKDSEQSVISPVARRDISQLRQTASELGFSVSDVFGAERILWVEGQTEEECYPHLFRHFREELGDGAAVVALTSTSAFSSGKKAEAALAIYDRVSSVASPFTKGVVVALDREALSDEAVANVHRSHAGRILLSERRTFENYLLHPESLALLLARESGIATITVASVEGWLSTNGGDRKYKAEKQWSGIIRDESWLKTVDAPNILSDLFLSLTSSRIEYRKRHHGLILVDLIIEKDADFLKPLRPYLSEVASRMREL